MTAPQHEPTGSVHEETARLFAALEGAAAAWSRGDATDGTDDGVPAGSGDASHLPTTCGTCPLCLALDRLGRSRPEVLDHLTDAARALGAALTAVARPPAPAAPDRGATSQPERARPRTEPIDVTD